MPAAVDFKRLEAVCMHDPTVAEEVVGAFVQDSALQVAALARAVASRDAAEAARAAHRVCGAGGNLGALALRQACEALEGLAQRGWSHALLAAAERVEAERRRAVQELESALER